MSGAGGELKEWRWGGRRIRAVVDENGDGDLEGLGDRELGRINGDVEWSMDWCGGTYSLLKEHEGPRE